MALAGRQVLTLAPEHLLLLICSHSAKHGFERLGWICDIARFLIVSENLVWPAAVAQARRTRTLRQFSTGIRLAVDLLRAPVPEVLPEDHLTGHYLTPSEAEYKVLHLPPSMYFLYYPFRPARLLTKHVLRGSTIEHSH